MHDVKAFKEHAQRLRNLYQEAETLRQDIAEAAAEMEDAAGCTNMGVRAAKREAKRDKKPGEWLGGKAVPA